MSAPYPRAPAKIDEHVPIAGVILDMLGPDVARVRLLFVGVGCHSADREVIGVNASGCFERYCVPQTPERATGDLGTREFLDAFTDLYQSGNGLRIRTGEQRHPISAKESGHRLFYKINTESHFPKPTSRERAPSRRPNHNKPPPSYCRGSTAPQLACGGRS